MLNSNNPTVVIDTGTGYTKLGYSGNVDPNYIIPTAMSCRASAHDPVKKAQGLDELDFVIGDEAIERRSNSHYSLQYPIKNGKVEDWDLMERYLEQCLFKYLRCDPEQHCFMMTECPTNTPENREQLAEVMFETFGVSGMYIAVQAVLALVASWASESQSKGTLTGTVIDSGDGTTHIVPVADGFVIPGSIKTIPLAGREITRFIAESLREHNPGIPSDEMADLARILKEEHCYVCRDIVREYQKLDEKAETVVITRKGMIKATKTPYTVEMGHERFLGPELFFNPEIFSGEYTTSLPDLIDSTIQSCPVDVRRPLYKNIVLSGGSTLFKNFHKRIEDNLNQRVQARLLKYEGLTGGHSRATPIEVKVVKHPFQRHAVWFGGSSLAGMDQFRRLCHTKKEYDEVGPACVRHNATFAKFV